MTNIIFFRPVYTDESIEGSVSSEGSRASVVSTETVDGLEASLVLLSTGIRMNCFGFPEDHQKDEEEEEDEVEGIINLLSAVTVQNQKNQEAAMFRNNKTIRGTGKPNPRLTINNPRNHLIREQIAAGWPSWLASVASEAIHCWTPRRADSFQKLDQIRRRARSIVYKARDTLTGKIVALKKVRFDELNPASVRSMAREILILRRLNHPNVMKLEGLVASKKSSSLYLVFEYLENDLADLSVIRRGIKFTEPQVKCYMNQLLSGLDHCHNSGVLHRNINGSNILLGNGGILKIAGFGSASFFDPKNNKCMNSRVGGFWYQAPEIILKATDYGVGIDLWSTGCILVELLGGKPILRGRTQVDQLLKIFKLCGSPTKKYSGKSKLPNATTSKPRNPHRMCIAETFNDFPPSSLPLIETLLAIEPDERKTASAALGSKFFSEKPYACAPSDLPGIPIKEMNKLQLEEARSVDA